MAFNQKKEKKILRIKNEHQTPVLCIHFVHCTINNQDDDDDDDAKNNKVKQKKQWRWTNGRINLEPQISCFYGTQYKERVYKSASEKKNESIQTNAVGCIISVIIQQTRCMCFLFEALKFIFHFFFFTKK